MRVFKLGLVGAAALFIVSAVSPASAEDLKSVVRTLNAIINPEDAWRLEDQARRYERHDEARYWHGYADGLARQRREHREPVPEYRGWALCLVCRLPALSARAGVSARERATAATKSAYR